MALIIPEGFAQITLPIRHVSQSREAVITFGVEWGAVLDLPGECDDIMQTWIDNFGTKVDEGCIQGPVRAAVGTGSGENLAIEGSLTYGSPGTASKVPSNVALLIRKITGRGGRRGRGRLYVPWLLNDSDVDDVGNISGTERASCQAAADAWLADLAAAAPAGPNAPMYVLHSSGGSTSPGSPNEVTGLVVDGLVATQRRRLRS